MPTTTIHYIPLLLITAISGIVMTMVGWKLGGIVTNPGVFLQPAVESAALDIAMVCDGKFATKTLPPPPPGASWLVMNCLDRAIATATSAVITVYQLYQAGKAIKGAYSSIRSSGGKIANVADDLGDVRKFLDGDTLTIPLDSIDDISDTVRAGQDAMEEAADLALDITDSFDDLDDVSDVASQFQRTSNNLDETYDNLDEFDELLQEAKNSGTDLEINCAEQKALCDRILGLSDSLTKSASALDDLYGAATNAVGRVSGLSDIKQYMKISGKSEIRRSLKELTDVKSALLNSWVTPTRTQAVVRSLPAARKYTRKVRKYQIYPAIHKAIVMSTWNFDLGLDYIDEHGYFYDILEGSFVGIKYTAYMTNLVNTTSEEVQQIYRDSFNLSGDFAVASSELKEDLGRITRMKGYVDTSGYVYNIETENLIKLGYPTNMDPTIVGTATMEYVEKAAHAVLYTCEGDACDSYVRYFGDVLEMATNFSFGDITLDELREAVTSFSDSTIQEEQDTFLELLDRFEEEDAKVSNVAEASLAVQKEVGAWMKENCDTHVFNYENGYDVEVAPCGMVLDCTPGEFCYVGLAVVDANPWIPYVPVSYLTNEQMESIADLVGLHYDSSSKLVTPGFLGCSGIDEAYICATTQVNYRCKIVKCGKPVTVAFKPFEPNTYVEDRTGDVMIWGNLQTW